MKKTFLSVVVTLIIAALVASCSPQATPSDTSQTRTMNVTGSGKIDLEPDLAYVNIGVRSEAADAGKALEENNTNIQAVVQQMKDLGVAAEDIQTRNFNIYPQQNNPPTPQGGEPAMQPSQSFVVENTVSVTVRNLDSLGEILAAAVSKGANTIYGVTFDVKDRDAAVEQARKMAIEDAQSKAQAIAEDAGVKLGAIQTIDINENSGGGVVREAAAAQMPQGGQVPISQGTLTINLTANLTYIIE
jgi:uncharacterized protein YggE